MSLLNNGAVWIADLELCTVLLKNDASYPWLLLIPQTSEYAENITEIYQLNKSDQYKLITEITKVSKVLQNIFHPDKINVGALGNIVPQLHIHVIARYKTDKTWPHSIWQPDQVNIAYDVTKLDKIVSVLQNGLS